MVVRGKEQEPKEKKPRRRGGEARRNNEKSNSNPTDIEKSICYPIERIEKNIGVMYSREELEALRFEKLEEQKKKWVEIYCRLGPGVVLSGKNGWRPSPASVSESSANLAIDCPLHADTSAGLRSLLRKCASLRAVKTEVDDEVCVSKILKRENKVTINLLDSLIREGSEERDGDLGVDFRGQNSSDLRRGEYDRHD